MLLKEKLVALPVLVSPQFHKEFIFVTGASCQALSSVGGTASGIRGGKELLHFGTGTFGINVGDKKITIFIC